MRERIWELCEEVSAEPMPFSENPQDRDVCRYLGGVVQRDKDETGRNLKYYLKPMHDPNLKMFMVHQSPPSPTDGPSALGVLPEHLSAPGNPGSSYDPPGLARAMQQINHFLVCLLYTSDAADE